MNVFFRFGFQSIFFALIICGVAACVDNGSPVAEAVILVDAENPKKITLSGEPSYDPNGDPIEYHWTIESKPSTSQLSLEQYNGLKVNVLLDVAGNYKFGLVVTDGSLSSAKDYIDYTLSISFAPAAPLHSAYDHFILTIGDCDTSGCHDEGTYDNHIQLGVSDSLATNSLCASCHSQLAWLPVQRVLHELVSADCDNCHLKSASHLDSSPRCEECHNTFGWRIYASQSDIVGGVGAGTAIDNFDHGVVSDSCVACHSNGASGSKPINHIASTDYCDTCHAINVWRPVAMVDHNQVIGPCFMCHDASIVSGRLADHMATSDFCDSCHNTYEWSPVTTVDHSQVNVECIDCHNGILAVGKNEIHLSSSDHCNECHVTLNWDVDGALNHTELVGSCEACHAAPVGHVEVGVSERCGSCHLTLEGGWLSPASPLPAPTS